jgi:tetratricopeptide (TPR) repeat protein
VQETDRSIRNWLNGQTVPNDLASVERELFGDNPAHAEWRQELREKHWQALQARRETSVPPGSAFEASSLASLPKRPLRCLGRDEDLKAVVDALTAQSESTAILVLGGPGMGKTTLTREAATDAAVIARYDGRRWFVELETATDAQTFETAVVAALGLDPAAANFDAALVRLGRTPGLLVLDNLETPWEGTPGHTEALLSRLRGVPGLAILASLRGNEPPGGVRWTRQRTMHPLEWPHDRELFLDLAKDIREDDPHLAPLLKDLSGIPLAVELVAQQAAPHKTLAATFDEWRRVGVVLAQRRGVERSRLTSLEISLELSFNSRRLGDAGRRLFCILGQLPAGVGREDLRALLGDSAFDARHGLLSCGLAFERGERLDLLPPVRDHARRVHPPINDDAKHWRHHYLALARNRGNVGEAGVVAQLAPELPNLDAAQRAALESQDLEDAVGTAFGISELMRFTGLGAPTTLRNLAIACRTAGDARGEAICFWSLGNIALQRSNHDAARKDYQQALTLFRQVDDILGEANCVRSLGNIATRRFDHDAARKAYEQAQLLYHQVGATLGEANCIRSLGNIALQRSDHDAARGAYEQALPLFRQVGDILGEANCIASIGDIALERSDLEAARKAHEQALPLYRQIGGILGEANCIRSLGNIALQRSDHAAARKAYEQALPLFRQVGDILGEANCVNSLGDIAHALADPESARALYQDALSLYTRIAEPYSTGQAHKRLASVTDGAERERHLAAAREAWTSIERPDLVATLPEN